MPNRRGVRPSPFDPAIEFDLRAKLIALAAYMNHTVAVGIGLQNGPDRAIELGIHQDHVLSMFERFEHDMSAKFHRAGDIDEHVDIVRPREQHRIPGRDRPQATGRAIELALRVGNDDVVASGILEYVHRPLPLAIGYRNHVHAWHPVEDLVGQTLVHEAGACARGWVCFALPDSLVPYQGSKWCRSVARIWRSVGGVSPITQSQAKGTSCV